MTNKEKYHLTREEIALCREAIYLSTPNFIVKVLTAFDTFCSSHYMERGGYKCDCPCSGKDCFNEWIKLEANEKVGK